jgi:AraC family transcriptional regulator, arabinose operon regulatory protein
MIPPSAIPPSLPGSALPVHQIRIPCNTLPLTCEADFGLALKPVLHRDRTAPFCVLIYLLKGRMEIMEDGVPYDLTPGTLFFLKSGVHHWGEKPFETGTAWYYVHFYIDEPPRNMPQFTSPAAPGGRYSISPDIYNRYVAIPKLMRLPLENELEMNIAKLIRLFLSGDVLKSNLALFDILLHCMELFGRKADAKGEDKRVQAVVAYLERHLNKAVTSKDLEKETGFTGKYIGTLFRKKTGMTIKGYQMALRINQTAKLLCETDLTLSEIANETGFYDAFYFSKMFKRYKGVSPKAFRDTYVPGM